MERPLLLTDGDCGFCQKSAEWIRVHIRRHPTILQYQQVEVASLGLTQEQCASALQYVAEDGNVSSGHKAVARLLIHAGKLWRPLGYALLVPGISQLGALVYRLVAANRYRLPGASGACAVPQRNP